MTWLTPWAALAGLLVLLPLAARLLANRRVARARTVLGLAPGGRNARRVPVAIVVLALLSLALAQPCLHETTHARMRTDAAAFVILDTSRSMAASPVGGGGSSRLDRAKRIAIAARAGLPNVPVGVATLTDRVLPDLFPTVDEAAFDGVVRTTAIEDPPPRETSTVATSFGALAGLGTNGFFTRSAKRRAVLLVTDGESRPFDAAAVRAALRRARIALVTVRVGTAADRVRGEAGYRPDPALAQVSLSRLGGVQSLRAAVGNGPTGASIVERRLRPLAPYLLLAALLVALSGPVVRAAHGAQRLPWARRDPARSALDA